MFIGGVDGYDKPFDAGFPLKDKHVFARLGAEKTQLAVPERGVCAAQGYCLAVKPEQVPVPVLPGHGAAIVEFVLSLHSKLVAVEYAGHPHKAAHEQHREFQPPGVTPAQR